jgi:hypothetical protein
MVEMQAKQSNVESKIGEVWAEIARAANRQTPPQVHIIGAASNPSPAPPAPISLAPEAQPGAAQGGEHMDEPQHQWKPLSGQGGGTLPAHPRSSGEGGGTRQEHPLGHPFLRVTRTVKARHPEKSYTRHVEKWPILTFGTHTPTASA